MKIYSAFVVLAVMASFFIPESVLALSPPWWGVQRLYANSIGAGPCVTVGELPNQSQKKYNLRIDTCEQDVAEALASILRRKWNFGGVTLSVKVYGPDHEPVKPNSLKGESWETLKARLETALEGNPYIYKVHAVIDPFTQKGMVMVECTKEIIQYWNDNMGDLYGNENYVAADVFRSITAKKFPGSALFAGWSTYMDPE